MTTKRIRITIFETKLLNFVSKNSIGTLKNLPARLPDEEIANSW